MAGTALTERPLVTIITGTWQRRSLLRGAILNLREQTHRPIQHLVVSDGLDDLIARMLEDLPIGDIELEYLQLGRNTTTFFPSSYGIGPLIAGCLVARGEFIGYLPDDDRMAPTYVEKLVGRMQETGADFAYSKARHVRGKGDGIIGGPSPTFGQIGNFMHRAELLKKSMWRLGDGVANDWALVERWLQMGARHAFVNEVLFLHRADH